VTKAVICNPTDNSQPATAACLTIENTISPDDFNIVVTGNEPVPDEFAGSNQPVVVTLGAGDYEVTEEVPNVPIPAGVSITRTTTFAGDCTDVEPGNALSTVAAGTIEAGQSQTCAITNRYDATTLPGGGLTTSNINIGDIAPSFSSPPTIAQGVENSAGLTSLEKVEKLKQQWLELLP
jgi:hypothetical protein